MDRFRDIFERIKIEELAPYFLYGGDSIEETTKNYEQKLNKAFKKALKNLKRLDKDGKEDVEKVNDILLDFGLICGNVYLEVGVLMGFQLYKIFEQDFCELKAIGAEDILKQYTNLFSKNVTKNNVSKEQ